MAAAISKNRVDKVFVLHPQIAESPERVDREVLQVLVHDRQAGRNPGMNKLFKCCSKA